MTRIKALKMLWEKKHKNTVTLKKHVAQNKK